MPASPSLESYYSIVYRDGISATPIPPHTHTAVEFYLTLSPLSDVLLGTHITSVSSGTLLLIPSGCVHQLYPESDKIHRRYILSFEPILLDVLSLHFLKKHLTGQTSPILLHLSESDLSLFCRLFSQYLDTATSTSSDCNLALLFLRILDTVEVQIRQLFLKEYSVPFCMTRTQQTVSDLIAYINEHICEPLTLKKIADAFFLNPSYVSRLFKAHTHITVKAYISLQKIAYAQSLLRQGETIETAYECSGYSSYSYFAKAFKKQCGITPGQYRLQSFPDYYAN